jgi:hypothetical protein
MKFLAAIKSILAVSAIVLLNPIFIAGHASAANAISHEMTGNSAHSTSQSPSCVTLCTTATLKDEEEAKLSFEAQDDEPFPAKNLPYYTLNSDSFIPRKLASSYVNDHLLFRPPDLVKLYSNFRF